MPIAPSVRPDENAPSDLIDTQLGDAYRNVQIVAEHIDEITDLSSQISEVIPVIDQLDEILTAKTDAETAAAAANNDWYNTNLALGMANSAAGAASASAEAAADHATDAAASAASAATVLADAEALVGGDIVHTSAIGTPGGIVPLGLDSKIAAAFLPSYVDDVLEFANVAAFPGVGETGKIYVASNGGIPSNPSKIYRWTGSGYTEITPSPGSTDAVPEGAANKYYTDARAQAALAGALATKLDKSGGNVTGDLGVLGSLGISGTNATYNVGITQSRVGRVGYHMYNGGGACEWLTYQPVHATGDYYSIGTYVAGTLTDRFTINPDGNAFAKAALGVFNDLWVGLAGPGESGVIRFGNLGAASTKFIWFDGMKYVFSGGDINLANDIHLTGAAERHVIMDPTNGYIFGNNVGWGFFRSDTNKLWNFRHGDGVSIFPGDIYAKDIHASRGDGTGVVYMNEAADRYIYWDSTRYLMPGGELGINGGYALRHMTARARGGVTISSLAPSGGMDGDIWFQV